MPFASEYQGTRTPENSMMGLQKLMRHGLALKFRKECPEMMMETCLAKVMENVFAEPGPVD